MERSPNSRKEEPIGTDSPAPQYFNNPTLTPNKPLAGICQKKQKGSISRLSGDVYGEAAYLAYYFHWSRKEVMELSRWERKLWLSELARINDQITERTNSFVAGLRTREGG